MKILKLFHYQSYFEVLVKGRKPRLGHHVNFDYQGKNYKGEVVEVGKSILIKTKSPVAAGLR